MSSTERRQIDYFLMDKNNDHFI